MALHAAPHLGEFQLQNLSTRSPRFGGEARDDRAGTEQPPHLRCSSTASPRWQFCCSSKAEHSGTRWPRAKGFMNGGGGDTRKPAPQRLPPPPAAHGAARAGGERGGIDRLEGDNKVGPDCTSPTPTNNAPFHRRRPVLLSESRRRI